MLYNVSIECTNKQLLNMIEVLSRDKKPNEEFVNQISESSLCHHSCQFNEHEIGEILETIKEIELRKINQPYETNKVRIKKLVNENKKILKCNILVAIINIIIALVTVAYIN